MWLSLLSHSLVVATAAVASTAFDEAAPVAIAFAFASECAAIALALLLFWTFLLFWKFLPSGAVTVAAHPRSLLCSACAELLGNVCQGPPISKRHVYYT